MIEIKKCLQLLISYYGLTRGEGHTQLVVDALNTESTRIGEKEPFVIVGHIGEFVYQIQPRLNDLSCIPLPMDENFAERLIGHKRPIIFDNSALETIFRSCLERINELEAQVKMYEDKIEDTKYEHKGEDR